MGPLEGVKVIEFTGIGPGPFCGMMLADMGAEVLRLDRADRAPRSEPKSVASDVLGRGRRSVAVDLKHPSGVKLVLRLLEAADVLIEGFRPGVMERLGLGPDVCLARNPRLVYGRMTGWGQNGPLARVAGHDINYIALAGALHPIGRAGQPPVPPLNLVGDFGGGGMLLAFGVLAALVERGRSGEGQVVDAAMVDGAALLMGLFHGMRAVGFHSDERGTNMLDGGAHFYDVYETADGQYVSLGSIEPQFYAEMLRLTGLESEDLPPQNDRSRWPEQKDRIAKVMREKTRDEWCEIMEGSEVCFAPVLSMAEAPDHPHNKLRETFLEVAGVMQAAPAPRFSRTPPAIPRPPAYAGQHTQEALEAWGLPSEEISALRDDGALV